MSCAPVSYPEILHKSVSKTTNGGIVPVFILDLVTRVTTVYLRQGNVGIWENGKAILPRKEALGTWKPHPIKDESIRFDFKLSNQGDDCAVIELEFPEEKTTQFVAVHFSVEPRQGRVSEELFLPPSPIGFSKDEGRMLSLEKPNDFLETSPLVLEKDREDYQSIFMDQAVKNLSNEESLKTQIRDLAQKSYVAFRLVTDLYQCILKEYRALPTEQTVKLYELKESYRAQLKTTHQLLNTIQYLHGTIISFKGLEDFLGWIVCATAVNEEAEKLLKISNQEQVKHVIWQVQNSVQDILFFCKARPSQ